MNACPIQTFESSQFLSISFQEVKKASITFTEAINIFHVYNGNLHSASKQYN